MTNIIKDAENAMYALEAAVNFCLSISTGDYTTAALDFVYFAGFARNAI